jgi:hypothetical protein
MNALFVGLRRVRLVLTVLILLGMGSSVSGFTDAARSKLGGLSGRAHATKSSTDKPGCKLTSKSVAVRLSEKRWPHITDHINDWQGSKPRVLHIARELADKHRSQSLAGIPTRRHVDRDELPMAMSAEGGKGADVRYVVSGENRSSGSVISHRLSRYCDGQAFRLVVVS